MTIPDPEKRNPITESKSLIFSKCCFLKFPFKIGSDVQKHTNPIPWREKCIMRNIVAINIMDESILFYWAPIRCAGTRALQRRNNSSGPQVFTTSNTSTVDKCSMKLTLMIPESLGTSLPWRDDSL